MGKEIEKMAIGLGHNIVGKVDINDSISQYAGKTDVAIEFTTPNSVVNNIIECFDLNIPIVTGTTAWYNSLSYVTEQCTKKQGSLLYASNFSISMNIFFYLNKYLAELMNYYPEYAVSLKEVHHANKIDKPSGTAVHLLQDLIKIHKQYNDWHFAENSAKDFSIPVEIERIGDIKGIHKLTYENDSDILSIQHEAKNRNGFAKGAILAANWLLDRKGVYSFDEFFSSFITHNNI